MGQYWVSFSFSDNVVTLGNWELELIISIDKDKALKFLSAIKTSQSVSLI